MNTCHCLHCVVRMCGSAFIFAGKRINGCHWSLKGALLKTTITKIESRQMKNKVKIKKDCPGRGVKQWL